jgi:hypothetical protein
MMGNVNNKDPAHVSQEHIMVPEDRSSPSSPSSPSRTEVEVESRSST